MISQLTIHQQHWDEMRAHIEQNAPLEACGLLAGRGSQVEKVILIRNQAHSPVRFVMDPYEQLAAFEWIDSHGHELVGIFHSHPAGPEIASATDIAEAAYEAVSVIWSRSNGVWKARGFWLADGEAINIPLVLSESM